MSWDIGKRGCLGICFINKILITVKYNIGMNTSDKEKVRNDVKGTEKNNRYVRSLV